MFIIAKTVNFIGDTKLKESKVKQEKIVKKQERGRIMKALVKLFSFFY